MLVSKVKTYVPNHAVKNAAAANNFAHWQVTGCTIKLCLRNSSDSPVVASTNFITHVYWKLHGFFIMIPK